MAMPTTATTMTPTKTRDIPMTCEACSTDPARSSLIEAIIALDPTRRITDFPMLQVFRCERLHRSLTLLLQWQTAWGVTPPGSLIDSGDLGALQTKTRHQPLLVEEKGVDVGPCRGGRQRLG